MTETRRPVRIGKASQAALRAVHKLTRQDPNGAYGTTIQREMEARIGRPVGIGRLYTLMDRLEKLGLVWSWHAEGHKQRMLWNKVRGRGMLR